LWYVIFKMHSRLHSFARAWVRNARPLAAIGAGTLGGGATLYARCHEQKPPQQSLPPMNLDPLKLAVGMPGGHDLTSDREHAVYMRAANVFYHGFTMEELREFEKRISATPADTTKHSTLLHIALKNAISKKLMDTFPALHCTVVFALYHENNRMVRCGPDVPGESHPNGENFIRRKHAQMSWLFDNRPDCSWTLLGADDGCDRDSAGLMERIAKEEGFKNVSVHRLKQAVVAGSCPVLDNDKLKVTKWDPSDKLVKDSQKGGAIIYGLYQAGQEGSLAWGKKHIIVYTDSDLSTDLGLCGLNFKTIFDGADVSVSERFGKPMAVNCSLKLANGGVAPGLARDSIVHLSLRHKLRMNLLPPLSPIIDTNCGHKAISAEASSAILSKVRDYKGSFDMDWLMCAGISGKARGVAAPIATTAIPWVASMAESNFWGGGGGNDDPEAAKLKSYTSWFKIFATMCTMHEWHKSDLAKTGQLGQDSSAYVDWVKSLDVQAYMKLVDNIVAKLGDKELQMPEPTIMDMDLPTLKRLAA
jgi:hypothetical protein